MVSNIKFKKIVLQLFFLIILSSLVMALPTPTGIFGYIKNTDTFDINIKIYAYQTGTQILAHYRETSARLSDGAYVEVLTTDYNPNLDILIIATSTDNKFHGSKKINNISPGEPIQIDIDMVKTTEEEPTPELPPTPTTSGGGGGGGGGGGSAPPPPTYDTERSDMPPLDDGGDEDLGNYLEDYYRQLEDEYQRWKEELADIEKQKALEKEAERQFNLLLEFALYSVILAVIGAIYFIYKQKKNLFIRDVLVKEYFKNMKKKKKN